MKTTYSRLLEAAQVLSVLAQKELDVNEALELARLIKFCDGEIKIFEEQRLRLCKKYGKLNAEQTGYDFSKESERAFSIDVSKLLNAEVVLPIKKVVLKNSDLKLKAADVLACEDFVRFEGENRDD